MTRLLNRLGVFGKDERGSATVLALFMCLILLVIGGMAVDFQKRQADQRYLQQAADVAAHAALYSREFNDPDVAKQVALDTLANMLPRTNMDTSIAASDITFGYWDPDTETFTADPLSKEAVRVYAGMTEARGNPTPNLLLNILGFDSFDVAVDSVYEVYLPGCFFEGFVADDVVEVQSNNVFKEGFCMHSNTFVKVSIDNTFETNTVVSMPDKSDLELPASGFDSNDGLEEALRDARYRFRALAQLPSVINQLKQGIGDDIPDYIDTVGVATTGLKFLEPADLVSGRITRSTCTGGKVTLKAGTYKDIVFVTDCDITLNQGVILEDAIIATTSTNIKSITSPSGFQLGKNDNCATGGGANIYTLGGVDVAADLEAYNAQILAHKDVQFAAKGGGLQGVNFQSYGRIDGTSLMNMGFCDGHGNENFFIPRYLRMVD